jgi:pimeloyl-ACP methyl ester carboxylesterase
VARDVLALAPKGVVALAPDMRGKGKSAGRWDSGGLDVLDILDAVLAAVRAFPGEVDARNLNIVGYSGGGGNAIACAVRFPDLFQTAASFFGIADYAWWHRHGGRPDCKAAMEEVLGGGPEAEPELYAARNAVPAAANALARMHFLWDAEEKQCPPLGVEDFLSAYERAGGSRATRHVSRPGDAQRWLHGYRTDHADIGDPADALFLPDVLAPKAASPQLPERGRLVVPGYLVTRRFAVWIGEAKSGDVRGRVTCPAGSRSWRSSRTPGTTRSAWRPRRWRGLARQQRHRTANDSNRSLHHRGHRVHGGRQGPLFVAKASSR